MGIVFCIYADPHGKHLIHDGTAHYLYETMGELESDRRFDEIAGWPPKYREDAYGTGKVRAFASKAPTLCPVCLSYEHTSRRGGLQRGEKVCCNPHCGHIFNEPCLRELGGSDVKQPRCSYRSGCPHGKEALCDYGKQHMFITTSYPGVESDAVSALGVLDKLIMARKRNSVGPVVLPTSNQHLSHTELAVYRLMVLGLVQDYSITYKQGNNIHFDVEFLLPENLEMSSTVTRIQGMMQERLAEFFHHLPHYGHRSMERELELRAKEYKPLETLHTIGIQVKNLNFCRTSPLWRHGGIFSDNYLTTYRTRQFATIGRYENLFQAVYRHLLLLLDHTYKDVVKMRYDMLWNLLGVVQGNTYGKCRREPLLQHLASDGEKARYEKHRCGLCDVCVETLEFTQDIANQPQGPPSDIRKEAELTNLLNEDWFEFEKLVVLVDVFQDYSVPKYRQGRRVLEGAPNNLPALFLTREFSPPGEYEGNARRLLRTANQEMLPLPDVVKIYRSSKAFKSELLLTLNEAGTACDASEGWRFLVEQAAEPEHHRNTEVAAMRECLDFMLLVEEDLAEGTASLKHKAHELENAFYA